MNRILGEIGALEERMIKLVHTIPNHGSYQNGCSSKKLCFQSSLLLNDYCGIQVDPQTNSDDHFLLFCLNLSSSMRI